MTPQEKAKELVDKFNGCIYEYPSELYPDDIEIKTAKQCALVAVDEILSDTKSFLYWSDVKRELELL